MCDNCPSRTTEHGAEWTRETSNPTGERPLPVPGGRSRTDKLGEILKNLSADVLLSHTENYKNGFTIESAHAAILTWHQAAIDAAVKEAKDKRVAANKSICGCPMCEFHTSAYQLNQPQEKK